MNTLLFILAIPAVIILLGFVVGGMIRYTDPCQYWLNLLIALDQGVNTLCGGAPDETISAVAYRKGGHRLDPLRWRLTYRLINLLFWWQQDHCLSAYESEIARRHLHPSYAMSEAR